MVDLAKLRWLIAERETSQRKVAHEMHMAEKTFYGKMKTGNFLLSEAEKLRSCISTFREMGGL